MTAMPERRDIDQRAIGQRTVDRSNDRKLLTPLLLMALAIVATLLYESYAGHFFAS